MVWRIYCLLRVHNRFIKEKAGRRITYVHGKQKFQDYLVDIYLFNADVVCFISVWVFFFIVRLLLGIRLGRTDESDPDEFYTWQF